MYQDSAPVANSMLPKVISLLTTYILSPIGCSWRNCLYESNLLLLEYLCILTALTLLVLQSGSRSPFRQGSDRLRDTSSYASIFCLKGHIKSPLRRKGSPRSGAFIY
ncbi:hypothetical protein GALMADRAFT_1135116 [Galerina marginata CBS 339.88]|uniref:Uncharacterized protein n=1 Tax=Galerina marginata (strain CBS 339.88) TaxID=685588 RepID=A0A067S7R6_GALM3|nr:hypothetical protein GALMADRAFT_1135116 [Galerina marginata CBS 339.88]